MHEPEPDAATWGFLNVENLFSDNYYGDCNQHDVKISHEQYVGESPSDTWYGSINEDELIAQTLFQEELSQLSIAESPELSNLSTELNWHNASNNYYPVTDQDGGQYGTDDVGTLCSSPGDVSCDGDEYVHSLEITDESELDEEVLKRLCQMNPVPHIPRINGDIPSVDEATSDHQRLLDRLNLNSLFFNLHISYEKYFPASLFNWHFNDRLELYDLIENRVQGDGNCQFRALSDQFYRSPEHHKFVRQQVVRQLKAQPEIYKGYVPMEYADYLKRMSKSGEWGDHVTLQAAADSYGVRILVVTSFKDTCYIEILPKDQKSKRVIYLSFWAEVHYNSIYPHGDIPPSDFKRKKKWWNFGNKQ